MVLRPGDGLFLKRGASWSGTITLDESGTSVNPITVGAYGSGVNPQLSNGVGGEGAGCISLKGSWNVVQDLRLVRCSNGSRSGLIVDGSAGAGDYNIVQRMYISNNQAGVVISSGADHNRFLNNTLENNNIMTVNTPGGTNDYGAYGFGVEGGNYSEIAYNVVSGNDAPSYDYVRDGSAVEVFGSSYTNVHHNRAHNNNTFAEFGDNPGSTATHDNDFSFNVVTADIARGMFMVTRGHAADFGAADRTKVRHNSVRLVGTGTPGVWWGGTCDSSVLELRNNVIQAPNAAAINWGDDYNLYTVRPSGAVGAHDLVGSPGYVSASDLHVPASSQAVDRGIDLGYTADADGRPMPRDGNRDGVTAPDMGAYEVQ